jgi:hypothetical protein
VVVNDDPRLSGSASVRWSVRREEGPRIAGLGRLRDAVQRKSFSGSVDFELPAASEPAAQVTSLNLPLGAIGSYVMEVELYAGGRTVDRSQLRFSVAETADADREPAAMPGFLAERLVDAASFRSEPDGFSLALLNRTRPAALTHVGRPSLDGSPLIAPRISVVTSSGRAQLPRRLELPVGRAVRLHFELGRQLGEGKHLVELELAVPGVASGTVRVEGVVAPEDLAPEPGHS